MQLRTEVEIEASPALVWRVLTDFARYHEWNPFITAVGGELVVGQRLNVALSPPEGADLELRPELVACDAPTELRWVERSWLKGLLDGEHFFQCREASGGRTRFVQGEDFSGLLLRFSARHLAQVARGFVYMNQALKQRAEMLAASAPRVHAEEGAAIPAG